MTRLVAILFATTFAAVSQAATIQVDPVYVQSFDSSMSPLGALANNGAATPAGGFLQLEFLMTLTGAAAEEDFWTAIFNVNLGPGLIDDSGWLDPGAAQTSGLYPVSPDLAQYDSNGPAAGGIELHWQFGNDDFGPNTNDLQGIIVEAASDEANNRQYGEALRPGAGSADALGFPTLLGALVVKRSILVATDISVTPIAGNGWGTYTGNSGGAGSLSQQPSSAFSGGTLLIAVPEPNGSTLVMLACLLLAWRRRGFIRRRTGNE